MKSVCVLQSNYLPWRGYFDLINRANHFVFYDEVQYTKNDWRNRNVILGKAGPFFLTIPVVQSKRFGQSIDEVRVADSRWSVKHRKSIEASYSKAPYFEEFKGWFFPLLDELSEEPYLSIINKKIIVEISKFLGISTIFHDSRDFSAKGDKTKRLITICKSLGADSYITGPSAQSYLDVELMSKEHIDVKWMKYPIYKVDTVRSQFHSQPVSVIDTICYMGMRQVFSEK